MYMCGCVLCTCTWVLACAVMSECARVSCVHCETCLWVWGARGQGRPLLGGQRKGSLRPECGRLTADLPLDLKSMHRQGLLPASHSPCNHSSPGCVLLKWRGGPDQAGFLKQGRLESTSAF